MLLKRGKVYHSRIMFEGQLYQKSLHTRNRDTAIKLESMIRTELIKGEF